MRETRVSVGDQRTRSGFLASLFPRFDEAVSPEFYRLTGKLRAITNVLFLIANISLAPQLKALGFDPYVHWRAMIAFLVIHTVDCAFSVALWRFAKTPRAMRRLTYASVILETTAVVAASWVYGSVNSPMLGIELVFVAIYRLAFDFRIGAMAFVLVIGGQWAVVSGELAGLIPSQPIALGPIDGVYASAIRELGAMVYLTIVSALMFATANWAVGRVRHREVAIRLLRESLYAADRGRVGRHTGRTLRDTYTLGSLIGSGGMGEVYRGSHLRTGRAVAVKMLHPHLVEDETVLVRFRREAEVTGKLGSEHIVGVIDVDEAEGSPFLVLELMIGESLAARIAAQGGLPFDVVADVIEQTARGLDVAHGAGVVHRDLKPENVFLCPRDDGKLLVKILDFGVSKLGGAATAITREVAILGTPDFMSPEQAEGHADDVAAASDVFALGALSYVALCGRRPFEASSVPAVLRRICDEEPTPIAEQRSDIPPGVAAVLAIAMAKEPEQRYGSAAELARDLRAALAGKGDAAVGERAQKLTPGTGALRRRKRPETVDETGDTHTG